MYDNGLGIFLTPKIVWGIQGLYDLMKYSNKILCDRTLIRIEFNAFVLKNTLFFY